jgi:hypothetical protein
MPTRQKSLAKKIRESDTKTPVEATLKTDERVLARITDGIYRQPASALRELISNAYDADATEVIIQTDAPRFSVITIRDNGLGLTPESLEHLIEHIGGSPKRSEVGVELDITCATDPSKSPGGRKLIGKLGIGLFSVSQFTRHFLIITKTRGDKFRTVADITLGPVNNEQRLLDLEKQGQTEIETGHARIWREKSSEPDSQGTEVKLLELLPRTKAELASFDIWTKIDFEKETEGKALTPQPKLHIGRIAPGNDSELLVQPNVPWSETDEPRRRFEKLVQAVRGFAETDKDLVDLEQICDRYLQTLWTVALAAPVEYVEEHPFDLTPDDELMFFKLENTVRGQAKELKLSEDETPRKALKLRAPTMRNGDEFHVIVDDVHLCRPIVFRAQPKTKHAVKNPLLFVGQCRDEFKSKPRELSGGPIEFESYLFWAPKIIPSQHQGVIIRVGNAAGAPFDRTFMGYQVSEQTRLRQITSEIFVTEGLDGAINIDRESFNYAHPHYQYLVKWLHSAIRQLTNRQKELGSKVRQTRLVQVGKKSREELTVLVEQKLRSRGVEDVPEVVLLEISKEAQAPVLRREGVIALKRRAVLPASAAQRRTSAEQQRTAMIEKKAEAIIQLLSGCGVLDLLSFDEQEQLIHDILEIAVFGGGQ